MTLPAYWCPAPRGARMLMAERLAATRWQASTDRAIPTSPVKLWPPAKNSYRQLRLSDSWLARLWQQASHERQLFGSEIGDSKFCSGSTAISGQARRDRL